MPPVSPIPPGYHAVIPYLAIQNASAAIDYYQHVFGAKERLRMNGPDGKIGHAEIEIGDSVIMLADESPNVGTRSPKTLGGTPVSIMLYIADVDAVVGRAVERGATLISPVENKFYGDRQGGIEDPFGHRWYISTHIEDVSDDELQRRVQQMMKG